MVHEMHPTRRIPTGERGNGQRCAGLNRADRRILPVTVYGCSRKKPRE
jgi:hypothetical protein